MKIEKFMNKQGEERTKIQCARCDTKGKILDASDATTYSLDKGIIEKVLLLATDYSASPSISVSYYLDVDDLLTLAHKINSPTPLKEYVEYKGSSSSTYSTGYESRQLRIGWWAEGAKGAGAYSIEIINCAGEKGELNQVLPAKKPEGLKKVKIILSTYEATRFFLSIQNYLQAKLTAFLANNYSQLYP